MLKYILALPAGGPLFLGGWAGGRGPRVAVRRRSAIAGDEGHRARLRADLGVALNRTMSLTVGLISDTNTAPPAGRSSTDTGLFTGINVKLGPS